MVGRGIERVYLCVVVSHTYHYEEIGFIFEGSFIHSKIMTGSFKKLDA